MRSDVKIYSGVCFVEKGGKGTVKMGKEIKYSSDLFKGVPLSEPLKAFRSNIEGINAIAGVSTSTIKKRREMMKKFHEQSIESREKNKKLVEEFRESLEKARRLRKNMR